jgi:hypothetical protein
MTDVGKAVQWRSCPKGHLHLGEECPCEHADRYRANFRQAPPEGSPGSEPQTDRVAPAGRRLNRATPRPGGEAGVRLSPERKPQAR